MGGDLQNNENNSGINAQNNYGVQSQINGDLHQHYNIQYKSQSNTLFVFLDKKNCFNPFKIITGNDCENFIHSLKKAVTEIDYNRPFEVVVSNETIAELEDRMMLNKQLDLHKQLTLEQEMALNKCLLKEKKELSSVAKYITTILTNFQKKQYFPPDQNIKKTVLKKLETLQRSKKYTISQDNPFTISIGGIEEIVEELILQYKQNPSDSDVQTVLADTVTNIEQQLLMLKKRMFYIFCGEKYFTRLAVMNKLRYILHRLRTQTKVHIDLEIVNDINYAIP